MNHGDMNHGDMGHSMPDMDNEKCSMNMLFTWDWKNTCVVFRWWHIKTYSQFLFSLFAIIVISMGYEYSKHIFNKRFVNLGMNKSPIPSYESTTNQDQAQPLTAPPSQLQSLKLKKSLFYGFQVGYSFMLMLVFMTYNGWLMLATVIGAGLGNYFWGQSSDEGRSMSCH